MTEFIENIFSTIFGNNVVLATILIAMVPVIELKGAIPFSMAVDIWGANALSFLPAFLCGILGTSLVVPILALLYMPIIKWLKRTKLFKSFATKIENRLARKKADIDKKIDERSAEENISTDTLAENNIASNNNENSILVKNNNQASIQSGLNNNTQTEVAVDNSQSKNKSNKAFWIKFISIFVFVAIPLPLTGVWTGTCLAVVLGLNFWQTCLCVIPANILAGIIITFVSTLFGDSTWVLVLILLGIIALIGVIYLIKKLVQKFKQKKAKSE